jgi:hypothetical protein
MELVGRLASVTEPSYQILKGRDLSGGAGAGGCSILKLILKI